MSYILTCIHRLPLLSVLVTNVMQDSVFQLANIRNVHLTRSVATKASIEALKRAHVCSPATRKRVLVKKRRAATSSPFPQSTMMCLSEICTNVYSTILFSTERRLDWQNNVTSPSSLNNVAF